MIYRLIVSWIKFTDIRTISNYIDNAICDNAQLVNEIRDITMTT